MEKAKNLYAPGQYRSTPFNENDWIIKMWWYELVHVEENGCIFYPKGV